jgi:hypothetical protein
VVVMKSSIFWDIMLCSLLKVTCSSKTSIHFQWTTWCYTPEDRTLLLLYLFIKTCDGTEEFCLLGYNAVQSGESQLMLWRKILPPSSGSKSKLSKKPA